MPQHINLMKAFKPSSLPWPSSRFGTRWVITVSFLPCGSSLAPQHGWWTLCPPGCHGHGARLLRVWEASVGTPECFSPPSLCPIQRAEVRQSPAPACSPPPRGCRTTVFWHVSSWDQGCRLAERGSAWVPVCRQTRTPEA